MALPSSTTAPRAFDADETAALLDFRSLVDALRIAAIERDDGRMTCPDRLVVSLADDATLLSMPAVAADVAIHKLVTIVPGNAARGLPTIQGRVTVIDPRTGATLLSMDGPTVTGRRTAAVSMLAIERLSRRPRRAVLVVGTGDQARHHVAAFAALWPDARVHVRGRRHENAVAFCAARPGVVAVTPALEQPIRFDVVITCTTSRVPVWTAPARARTLIVAVGSFRPDQAEIDARIVRSSTVFVDDPDAARHEAGDLILAGVDGHEVVSLADLLREPCVHMGPLLFKSVGCAAWDLAGARVALAALQARSTVDP